MNLKQLGILLVVVIVIGAAWLVVRNHESSAFSISNSDVGKKLLGEFQVNDVGHVEIKQGTNDLNLVKKDDLWRVRERSDYPANFSQISEFLLKARDLKIVQVEEVGPSQLPRMELAPGQGSNAPVTVVFDDAAGKPLHVLLLGKKHMRDSKGAPSQFGGDGSFPDGRWVMAATNSPTVALISDALDNVEPKPDQWLNKDFFRVEKVKSIEANFPVATNSWKLTRETETGDWKLAAAKPGEELDSSKISGFSNPFSSPSFSDVLPGGKLDGSGTNKPTVFKIETFDNFDYTVDVGAKTNDDYLVTMAVSAKFPTERVAGKDEKPEDKARLDKEFADSHQKLADKLKQEQGYQQWTYLIPSWSVDPVLKERSQLFAEKKEEPKSAPGVPEKAGETNQGPSTASPVVN